MDFVIIYDSTFGNTQAIARAIAETMEQKGPVRLVRVDRIDLAQLEGAGLIVAGCPTHRHKISGATRIMIQGIPRGALRGVRVAAFDTRYRMPRWMSGSAARKLARRLRKLGGEQVMLPESFFVAAREGPLEKGELEHAKRWAESILGYLDAREA
jgi:flavodoxin